MLAWWQFQNMVYFKIACEDEIRRLTLWMLLILTETYSIWIFLIDLEAGLLGTSVNWTAFLMVSYCSSWTGHCLPCVVFCNCVFLLQQIDYNTYNCILLPSFPRNLQPWYKCYIPKKKIKYHCVLRILELKDIVSVSSSHVLSP